MKDFIESLGIAFIFSLIWVSDGTLNYQRRNKSKFMRAIRFLIWLAAVLGFIYGLILLGLFVLQQIGPFWLWLTTPL